MFLIGDPKQAICAFRGADIFTYMRARDDSERDGMQYTLDVNWRSGSRLIRAVNALFGTAREPFVYESYTGFDPVDPGPQADSKPLRIDGVEPVPLPFWMLGINDQNQTTRPPGFIRSAAALAEAGCACAEYVAGLLGLAGKGRATIGDRMPEPGDIALLVRTHREGELIQQALRTCGISSVSLSEASVFETEDADELASLLQAPAEPGDEGRVRAALASPLLGRSAAELERLADQAAGERDQARQLRLESDEGLVKVVTLHKSKGLEYPLVFLPFPWS